MLVVSLVVTRDLPTPPCYEVRYEVRVLGANRPDTMVKDLALAPPEELISTLVQAAEAYPSAIDVWGDKTCKVTLRVRDADAAVAEQTAAELYGEISSAGIMLLNDGVAHAAHKTPSRCWVVLLSVVAAAVLALCFHLLQTRRDGRTA